jgi:hypothetical protein
MLRWLLNLDIDLADRAAFAEAAAWRDLGGAILIGLIPVFIVHC